MITERNVRFFAVLSMIALFVAGIGIGLAIDRMLVGSQHHSPPPPPGPPIEHMLDRFSNELGLRPEQKQTIHEILEEGRRKAEKIMERVHPELKATGKTMEEKILATLDPEQAKKHRKMQESRRGIPPGPPNGPHRPPHGPFGRHPPPSGPPGASPPSHRDQDGR